MRTTSPRPAATSRRTRAKRLARHLRSATRTMSSNAIHSARKRAVSRVSAWPCAPAGSAPRSAASTRATRSTIELRVRRDPGTPRRRARRARRCPAPPRETPRGSRRHDAMRRRLSATAAGERRRRRSPRPIAATQAARETRARLASAATVRVRRSPPRRRRARTAARPMAAIAPNITALTTVPASRASAAMSKATTSRLCLRATSSEPRRVEAAVAERQSSPRSSACGRRGDEQRALRGSSSRPAPGAPPRAVRRRRRDRCTPGTGRSPSTGTRPPSAATGTG